MRKVIAFRGNKNLDGRFRVSRFFIVYYSCNLLVMRWVWQHLVGVFSLVSVN